MSRLSILTFAGLLSSASPAAASQRVTEVVVSFDETVEAPAFVASSSPASATPAASQKVTEVVASFDPLAEAPFIASGSVSPASVARRQVTEVVVSFDQPVEAPLFVASPSPSYPALVSTRAAEPMQVRAPERKEVRTACTCDHR